MAQRIELDEGTAARRRVPFRLFTSNGTSPDTGASNDSVVLGINSSGTIVPNVLVQAVESAQGMYYVELSQSNVSVLGKHPLYHAQGDFPQHVATIEVVNSNPFSTQSHGIYLQPTTPARTLDVTATGAAGIDWGNLENPTTANDLSGTTIKDVQDTQSVNLIADQTAASIGTVSNLANHSLGTVTDLADDAIRSPSFADNALAAAKIAAGAITTAKFAVGAIDDTVVASSVHTENADVLLDRNLASGTDSGSSVIRTPRDALRALRNRVVSDTTQLYVYEEDDTTIKWTASLDTVASTSDHISGFDPNS